MYGLKTILLNPHQMPLTPQIVIEIPDDTPSESNYPSHLELDSRKSQQNLTVQNTHRRSWANCSPHLPILSPTNTCFNTSCACSTSSQRSLRDFQTSNRDYMIDIRSLDRSHYLSNQSNNFALDYARENSPLVKHKLGNHIQPDLATTDYPKSNSNLSRTAYAPRQSSYHCLDHNQTQCLVSKASSTYKMSDHQPQDCLTDLVYCHPAQPIMNHPLLKQYLDPHIQHQSTGSQYSVLESQPYSFIEQHINSSTLSPRLVKPTKKYRRLSSPSPNGSSCASSGAFSIYTESRPTRLTQAWKLHSIIDANQTEKSIKFRSLPDLTKTQSTYVKSGLRSHNPPALGRPINLVCQHSYRGECLRCIAHRSPGELRYCYPSVEQDCHLVCLDQCPSRTPGSTFGRRRHTDGCSIQPKSLLVINSYRRTRSVSSRPIHRSFDPIFQTQLSSHTEADSYVDLSKSRFSHSDYKLFKSNHHTVGENGHNSPEQVCSRISSLGTDLNSPTLKDVQDDFVQKSSTSIRLCSCPLIVFLVCMQLVLGCAATALSMFLMWILPSLQIRECAYWATVPLLLTGLMGTYFCPGLRLRPLLLHHSHIIKWISGFMSFLCSVLCFIICIFSGLRGNFIASQERCTSHSWNSTLAVNKTQTASSPSFSVIESSAQLFQQPCCRDDVEIACKCYDIYGNLISSYKHISCRYLFSSIKDYLILQSALTGIGAVVCLWFFFILIEDRLKLFMSRNRERFSFSSARSSLPGSISV